VHGLVVSFALHFLKKKTITVASLANLIKTRLHALNVATTFSMTALLSDNVLGSSFRVDRSEKWHWRHDTQHNDSQN